MLEEGDRGASSCSTDERARESCISMSGPRTFRCFGREELLHIASIVLGYNMVALMETILPGYRGIAHAMLCGEALVRMPRKTARMVFTAAILLLNGSRDSQQASLTYSSSCNMQYHESRQFDRNLQMMDHGLAMRSANLDSLKHKLGHLVVGCEAATCI